MHSAALHACCLSKQLPETAAQLIGVQKLSRSLTMKPCMSAHVSLSSMAQTTDAHFVSGLFCVQVLDATHRGVEMCDTSAEAPVVVYVSKMVAVPAAALPRYVRSHAVIVYHLRLL